MDAIPPIDEDLPGRKLKAIPGSVPALGEFPPGCPFRNRCPSVTAVCETMPALADTGLADTGLADPGLADTGSAHRAACWHPLT